MNKKMLVFGFCLLASLLALPAVSAPITVQSVLFDWDNNVLTVGPPDPPGVDVAGNPVQNGDFTIFRIPTAADIPVGNGIDDRTSGIFDFRGDPNYAAFSGLLELPHGKIFAATLELVLAPKDPLYTNDQISLENGLFLGDPQIENQLTSNPFLSNGESKLVTLDLLDFYSQQQLANYLSGGTGDFAGDGRIRLVYGDDSIVSGALLRLTANIPEPGTFSLLCLGLLPAFSTRLKKTKNV